MINAPVAQWIPARTTERRSRSGGRGAVAWVKNGDEEIVKFE